MITVVQELDGGPDACDERHCRVVFGRPAQRLRHRLGTISAFRPGELVAYEIQARRRNHAFVFRTLARMESDACEIAGVQPAVRLLATLTTTRQLARFQELARLLEADGAAPGALSDRIVLRAAIALQGRLPVKQLADALRIERLRAQWTY